MKCPWQREISEEVIEKELTKKPITKKIIVFGQCCEKECPFFEKVSGMDRCKRAFM